MMDCIAKKRYTERDDASTRRLNMLKKEYNCLSGESSNCSGRFLTDRLHRICPACRDVINHREYFRHNWKDEDKADWR